ncbi:hypothetical protein PMAYCL1PPCAC_30328, partial [Pristionchus mayeri]
LSSASDTLLEEKEHLGQVLILQFTRRYFPSSRGEIRGSDGSFGVSLALPLQFASQINRKSLHTVFRIFFGAFQIYLDTRSWPWPLLIHIRKEFELPSLVHRNCFDWLRITSIRSDYNHGCIGNESMPSTLTEEIPLDYHLNSEMDWIIKKLTDLFSA